MQMKTNKQSSKTSNSSKIQSEIEQMQDLIAIQNYILTLFEIPYPITTTKEVTELWSKIFLRLSDARGAASMMLTEFKL